MKLLVLIHTVPMIIGPINGVVQKEIPGIKIYNIMDDFVLQLFSVSETAVKERLKHLLDLVQDKDAIVAITCSSLSRVAKEVMPKAILVDDLMFQSVKPYAKILLVATAQTAIAPAAQGILAQNPKAEIVTLYIEDAIDLFKKGDQAGHDNKVLDSLKGIDTHYDAVVLAQASLAHLQPELQSILRMPILANINYMIKQIKEEFENDKQT